MECSLMKQNSGSVQASATEKYSRCYNGAAGCEVKYVSKVGTWVVGCLLQSTEMLISLV